MINWPDFKNYGWERTPYGQFSFSKGSVELTLLEPDFSGRAELMVEVMTERKMSQYSVHFPVPVEPLDHNEVIEKVERRHSVALPELKWTSSTQR